MTIRLRIMCWNIQEGTQDGQAPEEQVLPRIAQRIRARNPDIVLLNNAMVRGWPFGINQIADLANRTEMPYHVYANAGRLGSIALPPHAITGHMVVAVLSWHQLLDARRHPIPRTAGSEYATLEVTARVRDVGPQGPAFVDHRIFSTRFPSWQDPDNDNIAAHVQAVDIISRLDPEVPVIFGGDFNADRTNGRRWDAFTNFVVNSGLIHACYDPQAPGESRDPNHDVSEVINIDHIFFRGRPGGPTARPYNLTQVQVRCRRSDPGGYPSDHPWILIELSNAEQQPPPPVEARVPNVLGMSQAEAETQIRNAGLQPVVTGTPRPEDRVWNQSPPADRIVPRGSTVTLRLAAPGPVTVPHVEGLRPGQAAETLENVDLVPRFSGPSGHPNARVWRQSPRGGEQVDRGSTVTLQVRTEEPE